MNLRKKVCPGCGTVSPKSAGNHWFICASCKWESDELPTVGKIIEGNFDKCNHVNLSAFLRGVFNVKKKEAK